MLKPIIKAVAVTAVTAVTMSAGGAYAADSDTAYVPFVVNVPATITAAQSGKPNVTVTTAPNTAAGHAATLKLPLGSTSSVLYTGGAQGRLNAPVVTGSRGNITLRLPAQSYRNAEVALYSVNGKRILRGKADASEAAGGISRRNVTAGVYMLSVKGIDGNVFTSRLTHSGGKLNINVGFRDAGVSPERRLAKRADAEAEEWEITVSAVSAGYKDSTYKLTVESGENELQNITLRESGSGYAGKGNDISNYRTVTIGTQTWMAENLDTDEGVCYDNDNANCAKYGKMYTWNQAQRACPVGWKLPSDDDWTTLTDFVGSTAGTKLKSTSGWNNNGNGTDQYGFAALPGGSGSSDNGFWHAGDTGYWWSASVWYAPSGAEYYYYRRMSYNSNEVVRGNVGSRVDAFSVRCVQDGGTTPPTPNGSLVNGAGEAWVRCYEGDTDCDGIVFSGNGRFQAVTKEGGGWVKIEQSGTWSVSGSTLTMTYTEGEYEGDVDEINYGVSGNTLTLSGDGVTLVWTKTSGLTISGLGKSRLLKKSAKVIFKR